MTFHDRIDVLPPQRTEREELLGLVQPKLKDVSLQSVVDEACRVLGAPIALVSLVGRFSQRFVASRGLPAEMSQVGGTDRSLSFCQYVVRDDESLCVPDASLDERMPQALVREFGVRSYLGVPVRIAGVPVGSLCVLDGQAREFTAAESQTLSTLAENVTAQLEASLQKELKARAEQALSHAVAPLFGELRNVLGPVNTGISQAAEVQAELQVVLRALTLEDPGQRQRMGFAISETALRAGSELAEILTDLQPSATRLTKGICALESFVSPSTASVKVETSIQHALTAAEHLTKLVGGVNTEAGEGVPGKVAHRTGAMLAAVLGRCAKQQYARRERGGIALRVVPEEGAVRLVIHCADWAEDEVNSCLDGAAPLARAGQLELLRGKNSISVVATLAAA